MLICFDLDDTLLDHGSAERAAAEYFGKVFEARLPKFGNGFVRVWREAAERHMAAFLRGDVSFQEQRRRRVRELLSTDLMDAEADALFEIYREAYEANWRLFADVKSCLTALSTQQLGVITNGSRAQQLKKVQHLGLAHHFSFILSAEAAGVAKPAPAIFRAAQRESPPHTCVYVGDNLTLDAEAAQRAGWHGVWLNRAGSSPPSHVPTITSLLELPTLVAQLSPSKCLYSLTSALQRLPSRKLPTEPLSWSHGPT